MEYGNMSRFKFWLAVVFAAWVTVELAAYLHSKHAQVTSLQFVRGGVNKPGVEKVAAVTGEKNSDFSLSDAEPSGYIVCNDYFGQQGSAIRTLVSLQCWAASFSLPVKIVEPFMEGNVHTTLPKGVDPSTAGKMSDFFDLEHFNMQSQLQGEPTLVSWMDFREDVPTNIIVLSVDKECGDSVVSTYADIRDDWKYNDTHLVEYIDGRWCFSKQYMDNSLLNDMNVCVVRIVELHCLNSSDKYKRMYRDIFQDWDPRKTTLVLKYWRGFYSFQNPDVAEHINCQDSDRRRMRNKVQANKKLLRDVQYYKDHFLQWTQNKPKVSVMIRAERLVTYSRYKTELTDRVSVLDDCLNQTLGVIRNVTYSQFYKNREGKGVFLAMDVGKFGTVAKKWLQSIPEEKREETVKKVEHMVKEIYNTRLSFRDWENSFIAASHGVENPGYIAALQRALASQADCLILMGGGNFQLLAYYDYLEQHPDVSTQCIHFVCFAGDYRRVFNLKYGGKDIH